MNVNELNDADLQKKYIGLNKFKQFRESPFIDGEMLNTKHKKTYIGDPTNVVLNIETGEMTGTRAFMKTEEVDTEEFVKIYTAQIKDLFSLKPPAMKVLSYIISSTKINKDQILFNLEDCKRFTGYSSTTSIINGIAILLENNIIARSEMSYLYFINPFIFFNGNRIVLVREYKKKNAIVKKKSVDENQYVIGYNEQPASEEDTN